MHLEHLQKDYAAFNVWANTQIIEWLKTQPPALLEQAALSSFPSIRLTLLHIWDAEEVWLDRLKGNIPAEELHEDFTGPLDAVFSGVLNGSADLAAYIKALAEPDFHTICHFERPNGMPDSRPRFEMIQHCLNHSTYHRGQIVTMAHALGIKGAPATDFMPYVRSK